MLCTASLTSKRCSSDVGLLLKQSRVPLAAPGVQQLSARRIKAFRAKLVSAICIQWQHLTQVEGVLGDICIFLLLLTAKGGPAVKLNFHSFKPRQEVSIKR